MYFAAGLTVIEPNPEFEVGKISEFADVTNWCHHVSYILPQGRTAWWNPMEKADDEMEADDEEDEEEKEQLDEPEPETGPPLLTSVAEDASKSKHGLLSGTVCFWQLN